MFILSYFVTFSLVTLLEVECLLFLRTDKSKNQILKSFLLFETLAIVYLCWGKIKKSKGEEAKRSGVFIYVIYV